jgi:template-activating factor I
VWQFEKRRMAELYEPRREIIKGIPHFWTTALCNHPDLSTLLEADDIAALKHLESIDINASGQEGLESLEIAFVFATNPYFEDKRLVKTFNFDSARTITSASHMTIKWKPGQSLTDPSQNASAEKKRKSQMMDTSSFFMWFEDAQLETSSEIAALIYDELWPRAFDFYRNVRTNDDDDEDDDGGYPDDDDVEEGDGAAYNVDEEEDDA